jgi:high-affinity iron transporter
MGLAMLRISNLQKKWRIKISQIMEERSAKGFGGKSRKYAMFILPFITVLREGLEAVVFVGGVSLSEPATSFPLAVVVGILCGVLIGYFIYKYLINLYVCSLCCRGGALVKIKYFVVISSCLLYLVAAGLFSRGVWYFEAYEWAQIIGGDADELGSGPGTYDITKSVWYCPPSPQLTSLGTSTVATLRIHRMEDGVSSMPY